MGRRLPAPKTGGTSLRNLLHISYRSCSFARLYAILLLKGHVMEVSEYGGLV